MTCSGNWPNAKLPSPTWKRASAQKSPRCTSSWSKNAAPPRKPMTKLLQARSELAASREQLEAQLRHKDDELGSLRASAI